MSSKQNLLSTAGSTHILPTNSSGVVVNPNYLEDTAHTSGDAGTHILAVRNDTLAALGGADGDYAPVQVNATGAVYTDITDSMATLGTTTYSEATTKGLTVGAVRNDTLAALADTDNEIAPLQVNATGAVYTDITDSMATLGTTTYSEATTKGLTVGAVRNDTLATLADTDNEIAPLQVNANGALYVDNLNGLDVDSGVSGIATQRVTLATDDAAVTALQVLDNTVAVCGTDTYTETTTSANVVGAVRNDTLAALAGTDNEIAPVQVNAVGAVYTQLANSSGTELLNSAANRGYVQLTDGSNSVAVTGSASDLLKVSTYDNSLTFANVNGAIGGGPNLLPAVGSGYNVIYKLIISTDNATTTSVTISDGFGVYYVSERAPLTLDFGPNGKQQSSSATAITITSGAAANAGVLVLYRTFTT